MCCNICLMWDESFDRSSCSLTTFIKTSNQSQSVWEKVDCGNRVPLQRGMPGKVLPPIKKCACRKRQVLERGRGRHRNDTTVLNAMKTSEHCFRICWLKRRPSRRVQAPLECVSQMPHALKAGRTEGGLRPSPTHPSLFNVSGSFQFVNVC